jgi:hypothetical protein
MGLDGVPHVQHVNLYSRAKLSHGGHHNDRRRLLRKQQIKLLTLLLPTAGSVCHVQAEYLRPTSSAGSSTRIG